MSGAPISAPISHHGAVSMPATHSIGMPYRPQMSAPQHHQMTMSGPQYVMEQPAPQMPSSFAPMPMQTMQAPMAPMQPMMQPMQQMQQPQQFEGPIPLRVTIKSAKGLRNADMSLIGGKSDPYCLVEIPGRANHPKFKFTTKVVNNDLDPTWDETATIQQYMPGDSLKFVVYDSDPLKPDDILGECTLSPEDILPGVPDQHIPLTGKYGEGFLRLEIVPEGDVGGMQFGTQPAGQDGMAQMFNQMDQNHDGVISRSEFAAAVQPQVVPNTGIAISLTIKNAMNLMNADALMFGGSEAFCVAEIENKPQYPKFEFKAKVVQSEREETWDEMATIENYTPGDCIHIMAYDSDPNNPNGAGNALGEVTVPGTTFYPGGYTGKVLLSGPGVNGTLTISISRPGGAPGGPSYIPLPPLPEPTISSQAIQMPQQPQGVYEEQGYVVGETYQVTGPGGVIQQQPVVQQPPAQFYPQGGMIQQQPMVTMMGAPYQPTMTAVPMTMGGPVAYPGSTTIFSTPNNAFDMMDRNHDGVITRSEFQQGFMR